MMPTTGKQRVGLLFGMRCFDEDGETCRGVVVGMEVVGCGCGDWLCRAMGVLLVGAIQAHRGARGGGAPSAMGSVESWW